MNSITEHKQTTTLEQAADWYYRLREPEVVEDVLLDWQKWLNLSAANNKAFEKIEELMQFNGHIEEIDWPDDRELLADEYDGEVPIANWKYRQHQQQPRQTSSRSLWRGVYTLKRQHFWGLAGATLMIIYMIDLGIMSSWSQVNWKFGSVLDIALYETQAAENREITLSDGSLIMLGAKSLISVAYNENQRGVILKRGEAYFDIRKEPHRPFIVSSGNRTITAVGTAFNVNVHDDRVVVTVTKGSVLVAENTETTLDGIPNTTTTVKIATRLNAGQQIAFNDHEVTDISETDPSVVAAWRRGRLTYLGKKFRYVIADVNRYSKQPIRLGDEVVAELLFTGTVFQDNIDSWLASIEDAFPIDVIKQLDGEIILLSRTRQ